MKTYEEIAKRLTQDSAATYSRSFTKSLCEEAGTPEVFRTLVEKADPPGIQAFDAAFVFQEYGPAYSEALYAALPEYFQMIANSLAEHGQVEAISHLWDWYDRNHPAAGDQLATMSVAKDCLMSAMAKYREAIADFYLGRLPPDKTPDFPEDDTRSRSQTYLAGVYETAVHLGLSQIAIKAVSLAKDGSEIRVPRYVETGIKEFGALEYFQKVYPKNELLKQDNRDQLHAVFVKAVRADNVELMEYLWPALAADFQAEQDMAIRESRERAGISRVDIAGSRLGLAWGAAAVSLGLEETKGESISWLIEHGWRPDHEYDHVLYAALSNDRPRVAQSVLERGARINDIAGLQKCIWKTSPENVRLAHKHFDLSQNLNEGLVATTEGHRPQLPVESAELLRNLVESSQILSAEDKQSAFHQACQNGRIEVAKVLHACGAKATEDELFHAVSDSNAQMIEFLMDRGASLERMPTGVVQAMGASAALGGRPYLGSSDIPALRLLASRGASITPEEIKMISEPPTHCRIETMLALSQFKGGEEFYQEPGVGRDLYRASENAEEWKQRVHMDPPDGLALKSVYGFRPKTFEIVRKWIHEDMERDPDPNTLSSIESPEENNYAYNLTVLFSTPDRVLQYLDRHGSQSPTPLHDLAQFKVPDQPGWDIKKWGDAALQYGAAMANYLKFAPELGGAPRATLSETRKEASQFAYRRASEHPTLAAICFELEVGERDFNAALEAHKKIDLQKASMEVPSIEIKGSEIGMPGLRWFRAPVGDPRILLGGNYVNCCQHIGGVGHDCAVHSAQSPHGACYFLGKTGKRGEEIVAISWVWRGKDGELTLDSFEPIDRAYAEPFPKIVEIMATRLQAEHPEVTAFTIGTGGRTPSLPYTPGAGGSPMSYEGYRDSRNGQYIVFDRTVGKHLAAAIDLEKTGDGAPQAPDPSWEWV